MTDCKRICEFININEFLLLDSWKFLKFLRVVWWIHRNASVCGPRRKNIAYSSKGQVQDFWKQAQEGDDSIFLKHVLYKTSFSGAEDWWGNFYCNIYICVERTNLKWIAIKRLAISLILETSFWPRCLMGFVNLRAW